MRAQDITQALVAIKALRIDAASQLLHAAKERAKHVATDHQAEDEIEIYMVKAVGELAQAQHEIHVLLSKLGD